MRIRRSSTGRQPAVAKGIVAATVTAVLVSPLAVRSQRYVPTSDPGHPRIRYADSLLSLNDRCMVRKAKLNLRVRPVYVNGQPAGFC